MVLFTARGPRDLIAAVPHLLGFHPEDSVVLVTLELAGTAASEPGETFHARVDLPLSAAEQREVAEILGDAADRVGIRRAAILLYTEDACAAQAFCEVIGPEFAGIELAPVIRVGSDRFHDAADPEDPGTAYDIASHPLTAEQVLRGRVVHESRAALAESLVGTDLEDTESIARAADAVADQLIDAGRARGRARPPLAAALAGQLREHARWLQERIREWTRIPDEGGRAAITAPEAGRALVLVALEALREVAIAEMTREQARAQVDLWRELARRAPAELRPAAASLCAFAAWLAGDGALAWCALDRCFQAEPDDAFGHYVASLLDNAAPPSLWTPVDPESLRVFAA